MIKFERRYDEYAYRVAYRELDSSVTALEEGQWVMIEGGKLKISDGTKKSFLCYTSKRTGRDQVSGKAVRKAAYLHGPFELTVDQFDATKTFGDMVPLKVDSNGVLAPFIVGTDPEWQLVAYSVGVPANGYLTIISK